MPVGDAYLRLAGAAAVGEAVHPLVSEAHIASGYLLTPVDCIVVAGSAAVAAGSQSTTVVAHSAVITSADSHAAAAVAARSVLLADVV